MPQMPACGVLRTRVVPAQETADLQRRCSDQRMTNPSIETEVF
jgi:hypothetical protein